MSWLTWISTETRSCVSGTSQLDLRVYNLAALEILNPNMERIMENLQVTEGDEVAEDQPQTVKTSPKRQPPRSGFATSWK